MGEAWRGLKMLSKNTCDGVHLIVKLLVISLQACTFIKNELLHTYFWRILARFSVIIYCAFSRNHFMEGYFTFQWGGLLFRWGGASFLCGGRASGHRFWWEGFQKKSLDEGGHPPCPPLWETLSQALSFLYFPFSKFGAESCPP